ncbi:MAG: hypothetical protein ABGY95_01515 [Rubritalea sp.]|uniref:hypothetical protein n=1 Tax=Rubritalea sp. TaxID=2109375 RepID=UPI003241FBDC
MPPLPIEFEARLLWKTARLFKFLKWPSAHEVDFGAFTAEFDFEEGRVLMRHPDGKVQELGGFSTQKRATSITKIEGPIRVGSDFLVEICPATTEHAASIKCSSCKNVDQAWLMKMDASSGEWLVADGISLKSAVEGRDAFLKILSNESDVDLAVVLASLTVFLRFSV